MSSEETPLPTRFPPSLVIYFVILLLLCPALSSQSQFGNHHQRERELQKIFQLRNEDEWRQQWHSEKHVRCREGLLSHMQWACQKDIYRLEKRGGSNPVEPLPEYFIQRADANSLIKPWTGFVRRKRETKSITDECCSPIGCTWEEYAEYCPSHRRMKPSRRS